MERGIVYVCPSCGRYFDSPSVCSDGAEAQPHLMSVTAEQAEGLLHLAGFAAFGSGGVVVSCRCGWASDRMPTGTSEDDQWAAFADHVGAALEAESEASR
jgi:hypothetical protein